MTAITAGTAAAQTPPVDPKIGVVDEILAAQNLDQTVKQMFGQIQAALGQQIQAAIPRDLPPTVDRAAMMKEVADFQSQVMAKIAEQLTAERMKPGFEKIYSEEFTLEELQGIRDFQKSPAGQAMIRKQPAIAARGMQVGQDLMRSILPEIMQMSQEFSERMKKKFGGQ
jgi:hypothetical protein